MADDALEMLMPQLAQEMGDWLEDGPAPLGEVVSMDARRAAKGSSHDDGSGGGDLRV